MARILATVVLVATLGASGAAIYTHVHQDGVRTFVHRLGLRQNGRGFAEDALLAAGAQLQADHERWGTYRSTNVSRFDGMSFGYVNETTYCVQIEKAGRWYHMAGPDGIPANGPC